jgi:glycosyltransferase involved in cell wall biosynthesis
MLSVVLAVHNEEKNLSKCLESVKTIADEIIIADGESTDNTVAVAQRYGARVISTTNKSNFHINKQLAMDAAGGELVLQLDADEVLDAELQKFILQIKERIALGTLPLQPVAWYLRRRNFFLGRFLSKGGQYPDPVIRLYLAGKARLPQENVHEQMAVDGETGTAEGHLLHYAFPDFNTYMIKFNRYTSFEAERMKKKNVTTSVKTQFSYWIFKPLYTFGSLFLRHKGFVDGFSGFMFALMSAVFHIVTYIKFEEFEQK